MDRIRRILVVDDESSNRDLLTKMLKALGYYVDSAIDGLKALDQLKIGYDLILLDVMMPGMDGFEVVRKIRSGSEYKDIPICMVTGLAGREDRLRAVEAGANDFIVKPFDMMELKIRTHSMLVEKESREALKRYQSELEETVAKRTKDLQHALQAKEEAQRKTYLAQLETIERLAMAAEHRDKETSFHIKRVSRYSYLIAFRFFLKNASN
jgi:putative two-component system response regulator